MSENTWNVITDSLDLLRRAATSVGDAHAGAPTPCSAWTVAQVLQHAVGDQLAWAAALGVGTGPTENPFTPSGLLKGSVNELIESALPTARTAWAAVRADDDAVPTPPPGGTRGG
jgi:Mycothiol maleylpyruvate isomerase N-terminal domain